MAISPDRKHLLAAQRRTLQLIESATGNILHEVPCDFSISAIAFLSDGRSFVVGGREGQVGLWNTITGQQIIELASLGTPIQSIRTLADGFLASTRRMRHGQEELVWLEF
jgi:WD40 repeat protein